MKAVPHFSPCFVLLLMSTTLHCTIGVFQRRL